MISIIRTLVNHPLSARKQGKVIARYLLWQLSSRFGRPTQVKGWVGGLRLIVRRNFHASTACHYLGLPEFDSMAFVVHSLRAGDVFYDIGANIGAYSMLASGIAGAKSLAFEPEPESANALRSNIALNKLENKIEIHLVGVGANVEEAYLTTNKGIQNHIATNTNSPHGVAIKIIALDDIAKSNPPVLIKIDVEGYETAVINGATTILNSPQTKALIVERMGLGQRFGFNEDSLHNKLCSFGFSLFGYHPFTRELRPLVSPDFGNNLYLKDSAWAQERVKEAPKIEVYGQYI